MSRFAHILSLFSLLLLCDAEQINNNDIIYSRIGDDKWGPNTHTIVPDDPASMYSQNYRNDMYKSGLRRLTAHATSTECKQKIEYEYMRQLQVISEEIPYPFEDVFFHSQCPTVWDEALAETQTPLLPVMMREPPASPNEKYRAPPAPKKQPDWRTLSICYIVLVHDHAEFAVRIINAINEPMHSFVVHIDQKAPEATAQHLREFARTVELQNVWVLDDHYRQRINWGGFSMVNATLIAMHYAWDKLYVQRQRHFDYLIDISGTSYPIKSNEEIRKVLASGKPGAVYMDVQSEASRPMPDMWQMYVECDDRLHRIARMPLLRGMNLHIGSQWFALPKHVVDWFLHNPLPIAYIDYAKYIVVADENYFSTLLKNSPYCKAQDSKNLLFVLFDKWENERSGGENSTLRDMRKCLHPDPEHCGRSPTTLTTEYRRLLQVSRFMFARKFDPSQAESMRLVDEMEYWRKVSSNTSLLRNMASGDEGKNVMLRYRLPESQVLSMQSARLLRDSANQCPAGAICTSDDDTPIDEPMVDVCLEMGHEGEKIRLRECDSNRLQQWLKIGPCTEGSNLTFSEHNCAVDTPTSQDSFCILQGWKSELNLCLDISGENASGGSPLISWDCSGQWNQLFRFLSDCTLSAVQPEFIGKVRGAEGRNVTLCVEKAQPERVEDEEFTLDGSFLRADQCSEGPSNKHRFEVLSEDGPEQLLYRWKRPRRRSRRY